MNPEGSNYSSAAYPDAAVCKQCHIQILGGAYNFWRAACLPLAAKLCKKLKILPMPGLLPFFP